MAARMSSSVGGGGMAAEASSYVGGMVSKVTLVRGCDEKNALPTRGSESAKYCSDSWMDL